MANRKEFSQKTRQEIRERANGCCENCGVKVPIGSGTYDHRIPCGFFQGRPLPDWINKVANGWLLCDDCDGVKTNKKAFGDKAEIAKRRRQIKRQGRAKQSKAKIQSAGFNKTLTKGFNGKVRKR